MIYKIEEAFGVYGGAVEPLVVEVKEVDDRVVLTSDGTTIMLPRSLTVVEKPELKEGNEYLRRMQSLNGVIAMLKAIVDQAYPPDLFSAEYPAPDLGVLVAAVAHRYCDEHKLLIETQLKNCELRKEIARRDGELWAQPRQKKEDPA